jgi:ubiquinone biosynthesis protein COQ9
MTEDKTEIRDRIVEAFLANVPFDGWSNTALKAGGRDAGYDEGVVLRAFGGSMRDVAVHFSDWSDRRMLAELDKLDVADMKVRERIHAGIKTRLQLNAPYRESIRRLASFMALPGNAPLAARLAWRTSSVIWYWAGDRAANWNHYSKRGLLASVYTSTILYWLSDDGEDDGDYPETWAFLDRRIQDVLRVFGLPDRLKKIFGRGPTASQFSKSSRA